MADEKKQGLFGIEVDFSKDPDAERELQTIEQDVNEVGEPAFEGAPEFEEDLEYCCYAPGIFEPVKEPVTERLTAMTGMEVAGINLRIEDVVTPEVFEAS